MSRIANACTIASLCLAAVALSGCELLFTDDADGSGDFQDGGQGVRDSGSFDTSDGGAGSDAVGGGGFDSGALPPADDPSPDANQDGANPECDGAPVVTQVPGSVTVDATTATFSGNVANASGKGQWYLESESGLTTGGALGVGSDGSFSVQVPLFCGDQTLKLRFENSECATTWVTQVVRTDCVEPDLRITTAWDDLGRDWELHLIRPGGRINDNETDCTWTSCIGSSPDWGVPGDPSDDPTKDVDNVGNFGPENIYLSGLEAGTYHVMVEHWGGGDPGSTGEVMIQLGGQTYRRVYSGLPSRHVWLAATIRWPEAVVTFSDEVFDCTSSWSGGCTAQLP